jgi:branched-chain amino acid transport system substrate-binding protein
MLGNIGSLKIPLPPSCLTISGRVIKDSNSYNSEENMKKIKLICMIFILASLFCYNTALSMGKKPGEALLKKVDLGAIVFLTGSQSFIGEEVKNGMLIAKEDIEQKDKLNFNIIFKDSGDSPKNALTIFQNLHLKNLPIVLVTGDIVSLSLIPEADRTRTVLFCTVAATEGIPQRSPWVFRGWVKGDAQAKTIADFAISNLHLKTVSILHINNQFGLSAADSFQGFFEGNNRKVIQREIFEISDRDLRNQVIKIKAKHPDGIFVTGFGAGYAVALRQLRESNVEATILTDNALSVEYYRQQAGQAAEGVYFTSTLFGPSAKRKTVKAFIEKYRHNFKKSPSFVGAIAYDSTMLIYRAIKNGGYSNEGIRGALVTQTSYNGLLGKVDISLQRELLIPLIVKQIQNGKEVVVSKKEYYW